MTARHRHPTRWIWKEWEVIAFIVALVLIAATTFAAFALMGASTSSLPKPTPPTQRVEEDSPAWNCLTMGNHICGAGTTISPTLGTYLDMNVDGDIPATWSGCYFLNPKVITCPSQGYTLTFR